MTTNLTRTIDSPETAKAFLRDLHNNGESYHPDDSADSVEWSGDDPDANECIKLDSLMDACRDFLDPCEELLALAHKDKTYQLKDKSGRGWTGESNGYDIYFDFSEETDNDDIDIFEYLNTSELGDTFENSSLLITRTK